MTSPTQPDERVRLGCEHLLQGRPDLAARLLAQVLQDDPNHPEALHNLGAALQQLGEHAAAEAVYVRLLASSRAGAISWADYGQLLLRLDRPSEAAMAFNRALPSLQHDIQLRKAMAQAALASRHWQEALPHLEYLLDQESNIEERTWNRAALDLLAGRWADGWKGFESRWQSKARRTPLRAWKAPRWEGGPFPGKRLLLWAEQGMGDTLFALRHLETVQGLGGEVILEVQPLLRSLVANLGVPVVCPSEDPPEYDLQLPLLSLPGLLDFQPDSDLFRPYLDPPPARPDAGWARSLAALPEGRKVGLVWRGGDAYPLNPLRSLPDHAIEPLLATPDCQWVALQAGTACPWPVALDAGPHLRDFQDTAWLLSQLDLLVTVDTATANLAGALGLDALVLLHVSPDWRWMLGGERTPWYPTLRLLRQRRHGEWGEVLAQAQEMLDRGTC